MTYPIELPDSVDDMLTVLINDRVFYDTFSKNIKAFILKDMTYCGFRNPIYETLCKIFGTKYRNGYAASPRTLPSSKQRRPSVIARTPRG